MAPGARAQQPLQWNYGFVNGVATATYPGNVNAKIGVTGDASNATVTASGSATARALNVRASDWTNVKDYGAVADATGAAGVGTDNTSAFQAAMGTAGKTVVIPPGNYRFTNTVTVANGVIVECSGRNTTVLWFDDQTGTKDAFYNGSPSYGIAFKHCFFARTPLGTPATAGALLHFTDASLAYFEDNRIGYYANPAYNGVLMDCNASNPIEDYFISNTFESTNNDAIKIVCTNTSYAFADIFFENRNYFSGAANAGVELVGGVGWIHFDNADFDNNANYGLLATSSGGKTGQEANLTVHDTHFEGNGYDVSVTGFSTPQFTGNEFISVGGISCTLCSSGVSVGNNYSANTGLTLNGVIGWTEAGSNWSTTNASKTGMVNIARNDRVK
jgi:hypothetical protein